MRRSLLVIPALLASCAHVDTGQVDYRVAEAVDVDAAEWEREVAKCKGVENCDPILPSVLTRKYQPSADAIQAGEVFSVELEQAVIGSNLLEGFILGRQFGKHAEFAILANAFEFAANADEAATRRFLQAPEYEGDKARTDDVELKLVYFGDDIAKLQPFNFSHIPIMPRSRYNGGSIGIQIVIMEVDARSGPINSLLKTLAKFGQQSLPDAPNAKNILFDLGESLLNGSQDDRLFDYRFVLSNGVGVAADGTLTPIATFTPGKYVFRRAQQRSKAMRWASYRLDHNTGRLYRPVSLGSAELEEVRDELYFVVNVRRYPAATVPESYTLTDWSSYRSVVQSAGDRAGAPIAVVTKDLEQLLKQHRSNQWKSHLSDAWTTAVQRLNLHSSRYFGNLDSFAPACGSIVQRVRGRSDIAAREASDAVRAFVTAYVAALNPAPAAAGETPKSEFALAEREEVVSAAARYFMPWPSPAAKASFADAKSFETAYIDAAKAHLLANEAVKVAESRPRSAVSCDALDALPGH